MSVHTKFGVVIIIIETPQLFLVFFGEIRHLQINGVRCPTKFERQHEHVGAFGIRHVGVMVLAILDQIVIPRMSQMICHLFFGTFVQQSEQDDLFRPWFEMLAFRVNILHLLNNQPVILNHLQRSDIRRELLTIPFQPIIHNLIHMNFNK